VTASSGAFCGIQACPKAPEEVVTSGYDGVLYVQCGRDDHIHYSAGRGGSLEESVHLVKRAAGGGGVRAGGSPTFPRVRLVHPDQSQLR
jgi:hypothetical protein